MRLLAALLLVAVSLAWSQEATDYEDIRQFHTTITRYGIFGVVRSILDHWAVTVDEGGDVTVAVEHGLIIDCDSGTLVDGGLHVTGDATFEDTVEFYMPIWTLDAFNDSVKVDGTLFADSLVIFQDNTTHPEYPLHVFGAIYAALFEGAGPVAIAVEGAHATAAIGYSIVRNGIEEWWIRDVNGAFQLYDSDDATARLTVDGTTGTTTVAGPFYASDTVHVAGIVVGDGAISTAFYDSDGDVILALRRVDDQSRFYGPLDAESYNFAVASEVSGSGDSIVIDFTPDFGGVFSAGLEVKFVAEAPNTGACSLQVDAGTWYEIYEASNVSALEAGDICSLAVVHLVFDGSHWQQISQSGN